MGQVQRRLHEKTDLVLFSKIDQSHLKNCPIHLDYLGPVSETGQLIGVWEQMTRTEQQARRWIHD